jgi:hypothetical protein
MEKKMFILDYHYIDLYLKNKRVKSKQQFMKKMYETRLIRIKKFYSPFRLRYEISCLSITHKWYLSIKSYS